MLMSHIFVCTTARIEWYICNLLYCIIQGLFHQTMEYQTHDSVFIKLYVKFILRIIWIWLKLGYPETFSQLSSYSLWEYDQISSGVGWFSCIYIYTYICMYICVYTHTVYNISIYLLAIPIWYIIQHPSVFPYSTGLFRTGFCWILIPIKNQR